MELNSLLIGHPIGFQAGILNFMTEFDARKWRKSIGLKTVQLFGYRFKFYSKRSFNFCSIQHDDVKDGRLNSNISSKWKYFGLK